MTDITAITGALASIKTAAEIAKLLKDTDISLERADLKLQLAELVSSLADAKLELMEVQDELAARDARIAELQDAFQTKDELARVHDAYYVVVDGEPQGLPLCLRCWEVDQKQYRLQYDAADRHMKVCPACGQRYQTRMTERIDPAASAVGE